MYNWIRTLHISEDDSELFNLSLVVEPRLSDPWPIIQNLLNEKHNHLMEIRNLRAQLRKNQNLPPNGKAPPNAKPIPVRGSIIRRGSEVKIGSISRNSPMSRQFRSVSQVQVPSANGTPNVSPASPRRTKTNDLDQ